MSYSVKLDELNTILKKRGLETHGRVQKIIDNEVLRLSEPYTPKKKGILSDSGALSTQTGSGEVRWSTPYARRRYYEGKVGTATGALRGAKWFERMKNARGKEILEAAAKKAGGHT